MERRALQIILGLLSLIPLISLAVGLGPGVGFLIPDGAEVPVDLDNQFRYLSGVYMAVSLGIWWSLPKIEQRLAPVRIAGAAVFCGAVGRVASMVALGLPDDPSMLGGVALEGLVVPLLLVWQTRLARKHAQLARPDLGGGGPA